MKKYILITALVLMGALTSCSSDDNKDTAAAYEGTWIADDLSYKFGENTMNHKFIEMPGDDYAVYDNDKLVLTADTATLYEYKKSIGSETILKASVKDNVISFEDSDYPARTIIGVQNNRLTVVYDITMRGFTLPVTVIYNKK
ncbi:hypothetical protein [Myroides guanonis]|uniref:Lipocalin-like domain-containing protein n=1 Tax=Myroides guanonis TaxID=1150112 RepID=A0A1I3TFY7_9FLAO|nr:hypothetical protein [Myroides guanonis]SFJ69369.1 hypothetical protein SAMN04487893_11349 [Myroides guanonis]